MFDNVEVSVVSEEDSTYPRPENVNYVSICQGEDCGALMKNRMGLCDDCIIKEEENGQS